MFKRRRTPADFKELTREAPIKEMGPPSEVILPLRQHSGSAVQPRVVTGAEVKVGTKIARANGRISVPLHSSLSGRVKDIGLWPHPLLGQAQAIVIESDGQDSLDSSVQDREDVPSLSREEILQIVHNCGIVGLGGAAFPTHIKLDPPEDKPIDTFILNGAECEPYLTADYRLMLEKPKEIIAGMKIVMKVLGVSSGLVAIEENKPEAIDLFKELVQDEAMRVVSLASFYPQGAERQLIKTILGREVPSRSLPFDVGVVVNNVATCFAIYEAVYKNKPLYERVITVSGRIVQEPGNIKVRVGTKVKDIIEFCGGLTEEPAKVILGGPMMGLAQYTLDVPVIKGTTGIILLSKKEVQAHLSLPCIRCARCIEVCPLRLNPSAIAQAVEKERFDEAYQLHVLDCIECGICSYVCPARRDIVGLVKLAKEKLTKRAER